MLPQERCAHILEALRKHSALEVGNLAAQLHVSEATIRRDLNKLEKTGAIQRVHGGATLGNKSNRDVPLPLREGVNALAKDTIARKAVKLIKPNDVIFIDASSSAAALVPYLPQNQNLVVITNAVKTAYHLGLRNIRTYLTGGDMIDNSFSCVGFHAEALLSQMNPDLCFISCLGMSDKGLLTDTSIEETRLRQVVLTRTRQAILLLDSSKIGKEYYFTLSSLEYMDHALCETELPPKLASMVAAKR